MTVSVQRFEEQLMREARATPSEYWPNLLQLMRLFRETVTLKSAEASFRQGWQEAASGQTHPISELWGEIDVA